MIMISLIWMVFGIIGTSVIFYDDLQTRLRHLNEADLTVGEIVLYTGLSFFGPIIFYFAFRLTNIGARFMKYFDNLIEKIANIKVYTIRK